MLNPAPTLFLLSLLISRTVADAYGCAKGGVCDVPSNALLKCGPNNGLNLTVMQPCVCKEDTTWDKDILDCVNCWVEPISNGGNDYELGIAIKYQMYISCGAPPSSTVNLFPCLLQCRGIWQIGNTCNGYGEGEKDCICKYHYTWDTVVEGMWNVDCPRCVEGLGDKELADKIRKWRSFGCPKDSSPTLTSRVTSVTRSSSVVKTVSSTGSATALTTISTTASSLTSSSTAAARTNNPGWVFLAAAVNLAMV